MLWLSFQSHVRRKKNGDRQYTIKTALKNLYVSATKLKQRSTSQTIVVRITHNYFGVGMFSCMHACFRVALLAILIPVTVLLHVCIN